MKKSEIFDMLSECFFAFFVGAWNLVEFYPTLAIYDSGRNVLWHQPVTMVEIRQCLSFIGLKQNSKKCQNEQAISFCLKFSTSMLHLTYIIYNSSKIPNLFVFRKEFIKENFAFYSSLFYSFLSRALRSDFYSCGDVYLMYRVFKVLKCFCCYFFNCFVFLYYTICMYKWLRRFLGFFPVSTATIVRR